MDVALLTVTVYFRIFIDAATLKEIDPGASRMDPLPDFRIFIDAATLKDMSSVIPHTELVEFPHLYRCGHIEGHTEPEQLGDGVQISASL